MLMLTLFLSRFLLEEPCCCSSKSQAQTSHLGGVDFRRVQVHWWCTVGIITMKTERNLNIEKPVKKTIELAALPSRDRMSVKGGLVRPARMQLVALLLLMSSLLSLLLSLLSLRLSLL